MKEENFKKLAERHESDSNYKLNKHNRSQSSSNISKNNLYQNITSKINSNVKNQKKYIANVDKEEILKIRENLHNFLNKNNKL